MRKITLLFFLITLSPAKAQNKFCPPGAEWNYLYDMRPYWGGTISYMNETVRYIQDSIMGMDTVKVLAHSRFYLSCNNGLQIPNTTLIKQKGDTVFFRNSGTQHTWQILYNFGTPIGQGWQTTILQPYSSSTTVTYAFTVDSINYVTINNRTLKRLFFGTTSVTELFGWNSFLFRFSNTGCDGDYFSSFLCYRDDAFGIKQFSGRPCNFQGLEFVGIKEFSEDQNTFVIYPNPAQDIITLRIENETSKNYTVELLNALGDVVINQAATSLLSNIEITALRSGLYTLRVSENNHLVYCKKIIKE